MLRTVQTPNGPRQVHLAGWRKQFNDPRDDAYSIKLNRNLLGATQATVDLRPICSPIEDQGNLGSCTAHMFAALVEANEGRASKKASLTAALPQVNVSNLAVAANGNVSFTTTVVPPAPAPKANLAKTQVSFSSIASPGNNVFSFNAMVTLPPPAPAPTPTPTPVTGKLIRASRLFEYYATRKIQGTINEDSGASIRDSIKAGVVSGVVDEVLWPYNIVQYKANPPANVWTAAGTHKVTSYHSIKDGDIETMKASLISGFPVGFGFTVYDAFLSLAVSKNGLVTRPLKSEHIQGGHAVVLVGFDDNKVMPDGSKGAFLVRNSWGTGWGLAGYYWQSYNYVGDAILCNDFWVVNSAPL